MLFYTHIFTSNCKYVDTACFQRNFATQLRYIEGDGWLMARHLPIVEIVVSQSSTDCGDSIESSSRRRAIRQ